MSLEEFGKGHKGAGATPVELGLGSALTPEQDAAAKKAKSEEVSVSRPVYIPGAVTVPGSRQSSLPSGARFPEEFKSENEKKIFKLRGGKVVGETHDIEGNPLSDPLLKRAAEPRTPKSAAAPAPKGSSAESEYEDTLRKRMPFPGAVNATKGQRQILSETQANIKVLNDHWNKVDEKIGDDSSHPLYSMHNNIGNMVFLAQHSLNQAVSSKAANSVHVTNVHMRAATDAIHQANEQMHLPEYYTTAGSLPPVGTSSTDVPRAHALVEHAVPSDRTNLPKYIKLGRGGASKLQNTQETFERLVQVNREIDEGKHPGVSKQLARKTLKFSKKGTPKGGAEYGPTNPGPLTIGNNDMGSAFDTVGFAGARPTSLGAGITPGNPDNLVKSKKVSFVYVNPNAYPANAEIGQHKITGQRWAFVNGKPVDRLPASKDTKLVPFGKHVGQKVIGANGQEVPHLNDKGKPLSFKELVKAGAMHTTVQDINPAPSSPSAPAPKPEAKPVERNWDTLPARKRAAITNRAQSAARTSASAAAEIDQDLADRQKLVDHAYELYLAEKKNKATAAAEKKASTPSRKKKSDAQIIAEAAMLGITRRGND